MAGPLSSERNEVDASIDCEEGAGVPVAGPCMVRSMIRHAAVRLAETGTPVHSEKSLCHLARASGRSEKFGHKTNKNRTLACLRFAVDGAGFHYEGDMGQGANVG